MIPSQSMKPVLPAAPTGWDFLDSFTVKGLPQVPVPRWEVFDAMREDALRAAGEPNDELVKELAEWHAALHDIGGDPAFRDWLSFRPLRLSREEDWRSARSTSSSTMSSWMRCSTASRFRARRNPPP